MSFFKTTIPIDIEAIKALLPKDHSVEKIEFDARACRLDLFWHSSVLVSPFTFAVEFPVDALKAHKLPDNVTHVPRPVRTVPAAKAVSDPPPKKSVDKPKRRGR